MVHFALIQISKKHTEIFGTFIEIILKNKWELTIFYDLDSDEYSFVKYYNSLFDNKLNIKPTSYLLDQIENIDYLIITSSSDEKYLNNNIKYDLSHKCIYIQHQAAQWKPFMLKNIMVSPVIKSEELDNTVCESILPIYREYKNLHWKPNSGKVIFAVIGGVRFNQHGKLFDKNIDLIKEFINKYPDGNYEFWFFMRKWDWTALYKKYKFLKNNPKIFGFPGLKTEELIKSLHRVKFILPIAMKKGWFYWERLTGNIPIAINFNIPIILDHELAQIYKLEEYAICYEESLTEIYDYAINMNNNDYYEYVEKIVKYKKKITRENEKKFINLCIKQIPTITKNQYNNFLNNINNANKMQIVPFKYRY